MESNIATRHCISFLDLVLIIILIGFQLLFLSQVSSCTEPTNSVHTGQTLSKFTNSPIIYSPPIRAPSRASITPLDNNISNAYGLSLEIFLNKEFKDNCSLPTSIYNNCSVSRNISRANEVSLEIFLNKKIKSGIEHSHGQKSNSVGQGNVASDSSINNNQDTASEDNMIRALEKTTRIFKDHT